MEAAFTHSTAPVAFTLGRTGLIPTTELKNARKWWAEQRGIDLRAGRVDWELEDNHLILSSWLIQLERSRVEEAQKAAEALAAAELAAVEAQRAETERLAAVQPEPVVAKPAVPVRKIDPSLPLGVVSLPSAAVETIKCKCGATTLHERAMVPSSEAFNAKPTVEDILAKACCKRCSGPGYAPLTKALSITRQRIAREEQEAKNAPVLAAERARRDEERRNREASAEAEQWLQARLRRARR